MLIMLKADANHAVLAEVCSWNHLLFKWTFKQNLYEGYEWHVHKQIMYPLNVSSGNICAATSGNGRKFCISQGVMPWSFFFLTTSEGWVEYWALWPPKHDQIKCRSPAVNGSHKPLHHLSRYQHSWNKRFWNHYPSILQLNQGSLQGTLLNKLRFIPHKTTELKMSVIDIPVRVPGTLKHFWDCREIWEWWINDSRV